MLGLRCFGRVSAWQTNRFVISATSGAGLRPNRIVAAAMVRTRLKCSAPNKSNNKPEEKASEEQQPKGLALYTALLHSHPITTKAVTSAVIAAVGDMLTQLVFDPTMTYSLVRTARMAFLGGALVGPSLHLWYSFLFSRIRAQGAKGLAIRVTLDQTAFSMPFLAVFFVALFVLEGRPEDIGKAIENDYVPALVRNWSVWIPAQVVNFYFVPTSYQVLFANLVGVVWNCYLSYATHKHNEQQGTS